MGTSKKNKREETQELILLTTFKLFLQKGYGEVTIADIERESKLTRGAIYYELSNKEELYQAVIDKFVFNFMRSEDSFVSNGETPFLSFLDYRCQEISTRMKFLQTLFKDRFISPNFFGLLAGANFHYKGFSERVKQHLDFEENVWSKNLLKGIQVGEIIMSLDIGIATKMFLNTYYGLSFTKSMYSILDVNELKIIWLSIYNGIKTDKNRYPPPRMTFIYPYY